MVSSSKEYSLAYYHAHKNGDITCGCGKTVKTYGIYKHRKTKFHQKYLATIDTPVCDTPVLDTPILDTQEKST